MNKLHWSGVNGRLGLWGVSENNGSHCSDEDEQSNHGNCCQDEDRFEDESHGSIRRLYITICMYNNLHKLYMYTFSLFQTEHIESEQPRPRKAG